MSVPDWPSRPGISDEFLAKAGVTVLADPARLHIPYHDIAGNFTDHFRDRFKSPVTGTDGKEQRYSQPFQSGMYAYLPPFPFAKGEDLYLTEGEFKGLALCEAGYNAVALPGLYCYCDQVLLPELRDAVELIAPPTIFFIGDADTLFNLDFYRSAAFLADAFPNIPVRLIQPPLDGPKGVDDVRAEKGRRFNHWLDEATQDASLVVKGQNFVQTAALRLTEKAASVQRSHLEKLIKMATEATKTSEPLWAISSLKEVIQKCSGLKQAHFDKALKEKLNEGVEQSIGADHTSDLLAYYDSIKNNPWPEPIELSDILQELYDLTKVYIATEDDTRILTTLWAGITYARTTCPYLPMLIFTAPEEESGKTNYQTIIGLCCYRPRTLVGLSPNSFHRAVEESKGTFLIDEARAGADDGLLRSFLNAGFNNTGNPVLSPTVPRYNTDACRMEHFKTTYFKTFAGIGTFLERDTLTRSIIIRMRPYLLAEEKSVKDIAFLTDDETLNIARKFTAYWTDERVADFKSQCISMIHTMPEQLRGRHKQKFCPLYALAKLAGKHWYQRIEAASLATLKKPNPAQLSLSQQCMRDVATVVMRETSNKADGAPTLLLTTIKGGRDFIGTDTLITAMKNLPEAPWKSYGQAKRTLLPNDLYFLLKPYEELKCERPRFGPTKVSGMFTDNIMDVYRRHCRANEVVTVPESEDELEVIKPTPEPPGRGPGNRPGTPAPDRVSASVSTTYVDRAPGKPVSEGGPIFSQKSGLSASPLVYVTDEDQLSAVLQDLQKPGAVALDIETYYPDAKVTKTGKRMKTAVSTVTDRYQSKIRLLQLYRDGAENVWLLDMIALDADSTPFQMLRETLAGKEIIGHNITGFDLPWIWEHLKIGASSIKDTLVAHRLLYGGMQPADAPADLGSVLSRTLQLDLPKDQGSSDWGTETLTMEQLVYSAHDVYHLHEVLRVQEAELAKAKLDTAWKLEHRLAPIVVGMTNHGIGFNVDGLDAPKAEMEARIAEAKHRALTWLGNPELNLNSPKQLLPAFEARGHQLSGTSEEALKANGSEGALLLLEYRNIRDKELKFLIGLSAATRADGRIHAIFSSTGTKTGRFSCKDPNLQNIPKLGKGLFPIRSLFQAAPGKKLVIADFAQMELVAASVLAPEPKMLAAFQAGEDLHCRTASILLGRTVTKDDKANRSLAKAVNFGLLYGQSAPGLKTYAKNSYGVTMTDEESVQFRDAFFSEYQGLADWHERARADANNPDITEVRTHRIGRRQHLASAEHWWPRFASLVNTPIQGSCAEVAKLGLLDIGEKLKGRAQLVLCVHDEIIVECAEDDAEAVLVEVQAIMETRSAQVFNGQKIGVEAHIEDNWAGVKMPTRSTDKDLALSA
jgi:DNA polymerase-1